MLRGLFPFSRASRTQPGEFKIVSNDLENRGLVKFIFQLVQRCDGSVDDSVTFNATDVVVPVRMAVVAFQ